MSKIRLLALASVFASFVVSAQTFTIAENFTSDPLTNGWQSFGNTNLFQWVATNQDLAVTWDSTQTNSYFYHPLNYAVTANDDFSVAFDLKLADIASDTEAGKTGPMPIGFEFVSLAVVTNTGYSRTSYGNTPNIAGWDYYTDGYFVYGDVTYPSPAATVPSFVSGTDSFDYAPQTIAVYNNELPTNQTIHVSFAYTASNQTAVITMTTNGVPVATLPGLTLNSPNGFTDTDYNFSVDTFLIGSFSSYGDDYDSVLAHGTVANLVVSIPPPAQNLSCLFTNGTCAVQFNNHLDWVYTLQRTADFVSWQNVSDATAGNGTNLVLTDSSAPTAAAYYRVSASRP